MGDVLDFKNTMNKVIQNDIKRKMIAKRQREEMLNALKFKGRNPPDGCA